MEENEEGVTPKDPEKVDLDSFRQSILDENRRMLEGLESRIASRFDSFSSYKEEEPVTSKSGSVSSSHLEALGLDEDQAEALFSIVRDVLKNEAGSLEENITNKMNTTIDLKEQVVKNEQLMLAMYPDMANRNSSLWKKAADIYNSYDKNVKSSPRASLMAAKEAAAELGISPLSMAEIKRQQALQENGSSGSSRKPAVKSESLVFAETFGLDKENFAERLKRKLGV